MEIPCEKPFIKTPEGVTPLSLINEDARLAATPFPCGNCLPCRINKRREWVTRILLESTQHEHSCFSTLTYEDEKLTRDDDGTPQLDTHDLTLFLKRLRHKYDFRYFAVGEYGEELWRPHYHVMFFGIPWSLETENEIEKTWGLGFCHLGELNSTTAKYITGYCLKKLTSKGDPKLYGRRPEFNRSSRGTINNNKGGIGRTAVRELSENIKKVEFYVPGNISKIRTNGASLNLGRYLKRKLWDDLEIPTDQRETSLINYQMEVFFTNWKKGEHYAKTMLDNSKGKRQSIAAKAKIHKQRRTYK